MTNGRLLLKRFRTDRHCYVYDTYSNALLRTPPEVWEGLDSSALRDNAGTSTPVSMATSYLQTAQGAGYLRPCRIEKMAFYPSRELLHARMRTAITQLVLETTERCNFRCRYCAYTYDDSRAGRSRMMSAETARRAVDQFLEHSGAAPARTVSFWGGEPLIGFPLIQQTVEYASARARGVPIDFAFTTNATLITPDVARFLMRHKFRLLVSLDGPEHIHDRNRRRVSGRATFADVIAGLECLRDADPVQFQSVRFNCVVSRSTSLKTLLDFFDSHPLTTGHDVAFAPASRNGLPDTDETADFGGLTVYQQSEAKAAFMSAVLRPQPSLNAAAMLFARQLQAVALRNREPVEETIPPNGSCVPLLKKMVVTVNGDIYMCEQQPYRNPVGNIKDGIDFDAAVAMVDEYAGHSIASCRTCWASRLCGTCTYDALDEGKWAPEGRARQCEGRRRRIEAALREYAAVLETTPHAFDFYRDMSFSFPV